VVSTFVSDSSFLDSNLNTYLFGGSVLSSHKANHVGLWHRLDPLPLALLAVPLLVHFINHTLINWWLMAVAVIRYVASIAENNNIARWADSS
jgi:hypothetical protein